MSTDTPVLPSSSRRGCAIGAALAVLIPVALGVGWWVRSGQLAQQALEERQAAVEEEFAPALSALGGEVASEAPPIDLDKTVRVLHEIDLALAREKDLGSFLRTVARQDYDGVAPEVLEARKEILDVLMQLSAKQVELDDQAALWEITSELLLSTVSVVGVEGEMSLMSPEGAVSLDKEQAQELLGDLKSRQAERRKLVRDVAELETELLQALVAHGEAAYPYLEAWDELVILRDRAYLATASGDWAAAEASARLAVQKAPQETEAHLLLAMALVEGGNPEDDAEIEAVLQHYLTEHPGRTAPALLLMGTWHLRRGRIEEARLALQQSAAYYPRQAEHLTDMLDPYQQRTYLQKSREGGYILELYKATMLGAGGFSPDLQLARLNFAEGDFEGGRDKVLDHFARRRAQSQWDFILSDLAWCQDQLGADFWQLLPEDHYLDLEVSPGLIGKGLSVSVNNRSPRVLHNATLVLALHFTDMYPGDYRAVAMPETQPAVLAHDGTSFGSIVISEDVNGAIKTRDDVVTHRAILISDEAVAWVDTDAYKIAEAEEFRQDQKVSTATGRPQAQLQSTVSPQFSETLQRLLSQARKESELEIKPSTFGAKDDVVVQLPRELSLIRPLFRLRQGDVLYAAEDNVIEGDSIVLRFADVANFDGGDAPTDELELVMSSPFGELVLSWTADDALTWRLAPGRAP